MMIEIHLIDVMCKPHNCQTLCCYGVRHGYKKGTVLFNKGNL